MTTIRQATLGAWITAALLAGCASGVKLDDNVPVETRTPTSTSAATAAPVAPADAGTAAAQSGVTTVDLNKPADDGASGLGRTVYFDFDSFVVNDAYLPLVEQHAKRLVADAKRRVVIEGHTDERGGREYNLALGQKRAEAVARSLTLLGVKDGQVEAVSFGKERPAVAGSTEEAYAQNRRAEIKDR